MCATINMLQHKTLKNLCILIVYVADDYAKIGLEVITGFIIHTIIRNTFFCLYLQLNLQDICVL